MANTPTLSLRISAERQGLIRAIADHLKRADAAGDPSFGAMLTRLVERRTPPPALQERLAAIECRLAELEAPQGGHFGERMRAARENRGMTLGMLAELIELPESALRQIEETGLVNDEPRVWLGAFFELEKAAGGTVPSTASA